MITRGATAINGREPYLAAAHALLRESGCTIRRWRRSMTGLAWTTDVFWAIEVPEPRGPISFSIFAHEVGHQMLHRGARRRRRWLKEVEAWEYALATFGRFALPGLERAQAHASKHLGDVADKAIWRARKDPAAVAQAIYDRYPDWAQPGIAHLVDPQ